MTPFTKAEGARQGRRKEEALSAVGAGQKPARARPVTDTECERSVLALGGAPGRPAMTGIEGRGGTARKPGVGLRTVGSHGDPLHDIPSDAPSPSVIDLGGPGVGVTGQVLHVLGGQVCDDQDPEAVEPKIGGSSMLRLQLPLTRISHQSSHRSGERGDHGL